MRAFLRSFQAETGFGDVGDVSEIVEHAQLSDTLVVVLWFVVNKLGAGTELVCRVCVYGVDEPISPIGSIQEGGEGHTVRMWRRVGDLVRYPVTTVSGHGLDEVVVRVHPVHTSRGMVHTQIVGPHEACCHDGCTVVTTECGSFDAWSRPPICPEQMAKEKTK